MEIKIEVQKPPRLRKYPHRKFNRFGSCFFFGDFTKPLPEVKVDKAANQCFERLQMNLRFSKEIETIRQEGNIQAGWLIAELERYKKLCEQLSQVVERSSRCVPQLLRESILYLDEIKRRMEEKFPLGKQLRLHRQFNLPETDLWKDWVEWFVHCGEAQVEEDELFPDPYCFDTIVKYRGEQRLVIRVFKATRPQDIKRLFERPGKPGSGKSSEVKLTLKVAEAFRKWKRTALKFPPLEKPVCFTIGSGELIEGYIWLPLRFDRDDILDDLWPEVRKMQEKLPGGKAPKVHPTYSDTLKVLQARFPTPELKQQVEGLWGEGKRTYEEVAYALELLPPNPIDEEEEKVAARLRKRIQRLRGRGK